MTDDLDREAMTMVERARGAHPSSMPRKPPTPSSAVNLTIPCAELKAEIANLQQTLANEQRALANCRNNLGSCTPGQVNSIQQAIQIAQQEIAADQAKLPQACGPVHPPNTDHVTLQGIEVVQAIQDVANSVTLIAGKATYVRVYVDKASGTRNVTATLQANRGGTTVNLSPVAPITVDSAETLTLRRQNWNKSLNFVVPVAMMSSGTTIFTISKFTDTAATPKTIVCDNCGMYAQVSFSKMPPLRIRALAMTYQFRPTPGAALQTATPRPIDFALLQSWLTRAYPVSQVDFSQNTDALNFTPIFGNNTTDCTQADAQIFGIRAVDVDNGTDERTHYVGLVSNQAGFFRGCASRPPDATTLTVASGPAGVPGGPNSPINSAGDPDQSFADWYGGHELGHTFQRAHPGYCNGNTRDDPAYPFPNGQLSDATEKSFTGLDVGDTANSLSVAVLWGGTSFDMMTYCNQPDWPSSYTYEGIRNQLLLENPDFEPNARAGQQRGKNLRFGKLVHVVATINLTKKTGSINYVTPVTQAPLHQPAMVVRYWLYVTVPIMRSHDNPWRFRR